MSADCTNTQSRLGCNLTPVAIIESAQRVLGKIHWDFATDSLANEAVKAENWRDFVDDGLKSLRLDLYRGGTTWLNPPGESYTGGGTALRLQLQAILEAEPTREEIQNWLKKVNTANPDPIKTVKAADWYRALFERWNAGHFESAIWLLYRGGSFGCLGQEMLGKSTICLTAAGCPGVNGSGRISFETVDNGKRIPQTSNTQSSIIGYLGKDGWAFGNEFSQYGVIFRAMEC